jgi:hypothetical protein
MIYLYTSIKNRIEHHYFIDDLNIHRLSKLLDQNTYISNTLIGRYDISTRKSIIYQDVFNRDCDIPVVIDKIIIDDISEYINGKEFNDNLNNFIDKIILNKLL